jgi:large subunit ribosomal protein L17
MRHRRRGRILGRSPTHRRAMLKNLAAGLVLTEDAYLPDDPGAPKVAGRIITTLEKAKEVRPIVEKCITIARRGAAAEEAAQPHATEHPRGSDAWRAWRKGDGWQKWSNAMSPAIAARRRVLQMLGSKDAVRVVFDVLAPRFADRPGGYTRIMRLTKPRLGDAGTRAILEFVGVRDREAVAAAAPKFDSDEDKGDK